MDVANLKYLFTLESGVTSEFAGELPAGSRMHFRYGSGTLQTDSEQYKKDWLAGDKALKEKFEAASRDGCWASEWANELARQEKRNLWAGLDGKLLRGIDWALVRKDGVICFDARLTVAANTGNTDDKSSDKPFLIETLMTGVVDLGPGTTDTPQDGRNLYDQWKAGALTEKDIPLTLGVRFEATGEAPTGASQTYREIAASFERFLRLTRTHCVATGTLVLSGGHGLRHKVESVKLNFYEPFCARAGTGGA
jgi:hypothetical protein